MITKSQYYRKDNECKAKSPNDPDCICWHDVVGNGEEEGNELREVAASMDDVVAAVKRELIGSLRLELGTGSGYVIGGYQQTLTATLYLDNEVICESSI